MKKLMIAACAVAIAGAVQAATYNWTVGTTSAVFNGWDAPETDKSWSSATAQAGLTWYFVAADAYAQSAALADFRDGAGINSQYVLASGTTTASGISKTAFTTDDSKIALDSSGKLNGYLVVLSDDGDWMYLSATKGGLADTMGGTTDISPAPATSKFRRDTDGDTAYGSAGWYTAAPEPTSGLLLLLGVAGLALKRKRT